VTVRFVARVAVAEEDRSGGCLSAAIAENRDGGGFSLIFQCALHQPDRQDVALGMDTYCLVAPDQETDYGGVAEAVLRNGVLRIVVTPAARRSLGLADDDVEATLEVGQDAISEFRVALRRILAYGRRDARPAVLDI
jgi:hypothetical protein